MKEFHVRATFTYTINAQNEAQARERAGMVQMAFTDGNPLTIFAKPWFHNNLEQESYEFLESWVIA